MEMSTDSLAWPVMVLAATLAEFTVESPPELVETIAEVGERFTRVSS